MKPSTRIRIRRLLEASPHRRFVVPEIMAIIEVGPARLYPALARLEDQHEITSGWHDGPVGTRRRWYQAALEAR